MRKRLLSIWLSVCMVLALLPISAMAEEAGTPSGVSGEIVAFAPLAETAKSVATGIPIENLGLPKSLTATVRTAVTADSGTAEESLQDSGNPDKGSGSDNLAGAATDSTIQGEVNEQQEESEKAAPEWQETTADIPVIWTAEPEYDRDTEGVYVFTPVIAGYTVSADLPEITVTVGAAPKMMLGGTADTPATYGDFSVTTDEGGTAPTFDGNTLSFDAPGEYTVAMAGGKTDTTDLIAVTADNVTLNLNGVHITAADGSGASALTVTDGTTLKVTADSTLTGSTVGPANAGAGITGSVSVSGTAKLTVTGGGGGLTIGGGGSGAPGISGSVSVSGNATLWANGGITLPTRAPSPGIAGTIAADYGFSVKAGDSENPSQLLTDNTTTAQYVIVTPAPAPVYEAQWGVAGTGGSAPTNWDGSGDLTDAVDFANSLSGGTAYIKLLSDVNTTSVLTLYMARTVVLDLNGRTIESKNDSGDSILELGGNLTLTDSSSNDVTAQGKITGASNTLNGSVCVEYGASLTMNGGNITGNSGNIGGVFVVGGSFTMNGGSISDNHSAYNGGGISLQSNGSTFIMNGGSITNNNAERSGGGVSVTSGAGFTMNSGSITNNTAQNGGGVFDMGSFIMTGGSITGNTAQSAGGVSANDSFTVGGTAVITGNTSGTAPDTVASNVYLTASQTPPAQYTLSISAAKPLVTGASIGISTAFVPNQANPLTFTGANNNDYSGYFTSDNSAYVVQNSGSGNAQAVQLAVKTEAKWGYTNGDGITWIAGGTLTDAVAYANNYPYDSACIQLQSDTKTTGTLNFQKKIILDLNGKTIDANKGNFSVLTIQNGASLVLRDSSTADLARQGKITGGATTQNGGGILIQAGGGVRMEGGSITGNAAVLGGGVYVTGLSVSPYTPGTLLMDGGSIAGNTASSNGGGVYVNFYSHLNLYGGSIAGNIANSAGGGVYVDGTVDDKTSSFTMQAGSITGNSAANGGGMFFCGNASTMSAGSIAGNTASESGGGVYVGNSYTGNSFTVTNTAAISGNTAKNGGGVYIYGDFKMAGGSIAENTASESGGGVYTCAGYSTMTGGSIARNTASQNGGGVYCGSGFIVSGGSVTGNSSRQGNGGGVYVTTGNFPVGGTVVVTGNTKGEADAAVANNVYLPKGVVISYAEANFSVPPLAAGTSIGVTTETAPVKGAPVNISGVKQNTDNSSYFFSDNNAYMVKNSNQYTYCTVQLTAAPEARWGLAGPGGAIPSTWAGSGDLTEAISYAGGLSFPNTAYIQLLADVSTNVGLRFNSGKSAILDLNGKTVNSQIHSGDSILIVFGNLTLTDSSSADVTNQGRITGNSGADGGGGAYVFGGSFTMTGGNITGNSASNGGGVYVTSGSFTMTGGSISKNGTTDASGIGGVYVQSGTLIVGGTAVITGNTRGADQVASNLNLQNGGTVTVGSALTTGASIGVTTQQMPTGTNPVNITGKNSADYSKYFTSDNSAYVVQNSGSGSAQVVQLAVNPANTPPGITTTGLPGGVVDTAYSQTLAATGAKPITWSVASGDLPAGLSLDAGTGVISGTPKTTGTFAFTVKAANGIAPDATKSLSITVTSSITSVTVTPATVTMKKTKTQQFTATVEGVVDQSVTWSVSGGIKSTIDQNGLLTVGQMETATTLTITATSKVDGSRSGTATVTVTAVPKICTVTFDSDGGTPASTSTSGIEEGNTTALPNAPTKENCRFDGWYTAKAGGGTQFTSATPVKDSITVYAKWTTLVTVTGIVVNYDDTPIQGAGVTLAPAYGTSAATAGADGKFSFASIPQDSFTATAAFADGSTVTVNVTGDYGNVKIVKPKPYITITTQPQDAVLVKGIEGQSAVFEIEGTRTPYIADQVGYLWYWLKGATPDTMKDELMTGSGSLMTLNQDNDNIPDRGTYKLYGYAYDGDAGIEAYSRVANLKVVGTNTIAGVIKQADGTPVSGATVELEYAGGVWPYGDVALTSSAVTQTTAADGAYKFELVPDGKYNLIITLPGGGKMVCGPYDFPGSNPPADPTTPIDPGIVIPDKAEIYVSGQPQDATVKNGTAVTLAVDAAATDGTELTYQWYKAAKNDPGSGEAITGATAGTYTPDTAEKGTAYYYCVVAGGSLPPVTTRVAKVTVFTYGIIQGTVQTKDGQPIEGAKVELICLDNPAPSKLTDSTNPQITLADGRYQFSEVPDGTYELKITLPGADGPIFVVEPVNVPNVNPDIPVIPPDQPTISITKQPASQIVALNDTAEFTVNAGVSNDGTVLYQWYRSTTGSTADGTAIYGATKNTYRAPTDTKGVVYYYCVVQATGADAVTSGIAKLTVRNTPLNNLMTIEGDVVDEHGDKVENAEVTLSPKAGTSENPQTTKADGHYKFENLPDGKYTITVKLPDGGVMTQEITINDGEITPALPNNIVVPATNSITVTQQPQSVQVTTDMPAVFTAAATATKEGVTYQWYKSTTDTNSGGTKLAGQTGATLNLGKQPQGVSYYYCVISSPGAEDVTTNTAKLTVKEAEGDKGDLNGGIVSDDNGNPVSGATVKLMKNGTDGIQFGSTVTTGADGKFMFTDIPYGSYSLVAQKDNSTVTRQITVKSASTIQNLIMPGGAKITKVVIEGSNTPSAAVENLEGMFTGTDTAIAQQPGATVEIKLVLEQQDSPADKDKINAALAENQQVGLYLDAKLVKTINGTVANDATENIQPQAGQTLRIVLDLPAALQGKTGYQIIRSHTENGVTDVRAITPDYDSDLQTLSFDADAFSTYAVVYTQTQGQKYSVTVLGSQAGTGSGSGLYEDGATVTIQAGTKSGYTFDGWTTSDGVSFANAGSATTSFTMPAGNVTVTAAWKSIGGGGNGNHGGGNSNSGGDTDNPGGSTDNPGGSTDNPGGSTDNPGGSTDNPGGSTDNPGGSTDNPGGSTDNPGGSTDNPGSGTDNPGGSNSNNPGDGTSNPGGSTDNPGDDTSNPSGSNNNSGVGNTNSGGSTTSGNSNNDVIVKTTPDNSSSSSNITDASNLNETKDNALQQIADERQKTISALPDSLTDKQRQKALDEINRIYTEAVKGIQNLDSTGAIGDITNQAVRDFADVVAGTGVAGAGGEVPTQAPANKEKPFVLLSAALAAAAVLGAVLSWRRREDEETDDGNHKRRRSRIIATAAAVAAILLFLLTTGWHGITFTNWWTVAVAVPTAGSLFYALRHE